MPTWNTSGYLIDNVGWFWYASGTRIISASSGARPLLMSNWSQKRAICEKIHLCVYGREKTKQQGKRTYNKKSCFKSLREASYNISEEKVISSIRCFFVTKRNKMLEEMLSLLIQKQFKVNISTSNWNTVRFSYLRKPSQRTSKVKQFLVVRKKK